MKSEVKMAATAQDLAKSQGGEDPPRMADDIYAAICRQVLAHIRQILAQWRQWAC